MDRKESISFAKALVATKKIDFKIKVVAVKAEALEADLVIACEQLVASDNQKELNKIFKDNPAAKAWWDEQQEEEEEEEGAGSEVDPPTEVEYSAATLAAAEVVEVEPEENESEADFILRICKKVDSLDDEGWDALGEVTQDWTNARNEETKQAKKKAAEADKKKTTTAADKKDKKKAASGSSETTSTRLSGGAAEKAAAGKEWKDGSATQLIFELMKKAGKKGILLETAQKKAVEMQKELKIEKESRVLQKTKNTFNAAVIRGLATVDGNKYTVN